MTREFCNVHNKWHPKGPGCGVIVTGDTIAEAGRAYAVAAIEADNREAAHGTGAGERRMKAEQHRQRLLAAVRLTL